MRVGEIIGQVTLTRLYPKLEGGRFLIVQPHDPEALKGAKKPDGEVVVIYDELGASDGSVVGFSEGREGAMPFYPEKVPVDAYGACILDEVRVVGG